MSDEQEPRWPVVLGAGLGLLLGGIGVWTLLQEADDTNPGAAVKWLVGLAVVHDLVVVPLVLLVGSVLRRLLPTPVRAWVAAGLLVTGTVALTAWPLVRGYGLAADNPSILPRDYGAGLATVLILVWIAIGALALLERRRTRAARS